MKLGSLPRSRVSAVRFYRHLREFQFLVARFHYEIDDEAYYCHRSEEADDEHYRYRYNRIFEHLFRHIRHVRVYLCVVHHRIRSSILVVRVGSVAECDDCCSGIFLCAGVSILVSYYGVRCRCPVAVSCHRREGSRQCHADNQCCYNSFHIRYVFCFVDVLSCFSS